jgi:putative nucleotide binding protein
MTYTPYPKQMEEQAYVIDFLPYGKSDDPRRQPVVQALGEQFFTLLELYPKPGMNLEIGEKIYVGKGERDKIISIRGRITYEELTSNGKTSLTDIILKLIELREPEFIAFFNRSGSINIRQHQLELIPGIGKKIMNVIIDEREKKPFENFADLEKRIHMSKVNELVAQRIEEELKGSKYYIFVRPSRY